MVLAEVLVEMFNLKFRINELEHYLYRVAVIDPTVADEATTKLLNLMDKHRSHVITVNRMNNSIKVKIGDAEVSLADALIIANALKRKVDLLNTLINDVNCKLDILSLIKQRDEQLNNYNAISNSLKIIEWGTEVD